MGDRVSEIAARLAGATPGRWLVQPRGECDNCTQTHVVEDRWASEPGECGASLSQWRPHIVGCVDDLRSGDAALIAHAPDDLAFLLAENERLARERDEARAELEVERRKDHAYNAWTGGYEAAIADWQAGRTALWPAARPATPEARHA